MIVNKFLLPNVREMLTMVPGERVFTTLDLASAADHQIKLDVETQDLMEFITPMGHSSFGACRSG